MPANNVHHNFCGVRGYLKGVQPLKAAFFGTFFAEAKKVHITPSQAWKKEKSHTVAV